MKQVAEKTTMKGVYTFTKAKLKSPYQFALNEKIGQLRDQGKDFSKELQELHSICEIEKWTIENIIPTVGRTMIADNLTNSTPDNTPYAN